MKILFTFCTLILFSGCEIAYEKKQLVEIDASINITKTDEGYNIYSNKGELILEYTTQNCDSSSLETLREIFQTAKEFYDKKVPKEVKRIKTITEKFYDHN